MKKNYMKPAMRVVQIQQKECILDASLDTNVGLNYGGGGSGTARSRSSDGWDDDD